MTRPCLVWNGRGWFRRYRLTGNKPVTVGPYVNADGAYWGLCLPVTV